MEHRKPLTWPDCWKKPSAIKKVLLGIPIVGPQAKTYKQICAQLEERTTDCLVNWGDNPERQYFAAEVSRILKTNLKWPNSFFIPADPFEILCWDKEAYPIDMLTIEDVIQEIETSVGKRLPGSFWLASLSKPFGEVVDELLEAKKSFANSKK